MTEILVCVDGSGYADNICINAAWAAKRLNANVNLLHVLRRHSDYNAPHDDHTGAIGLGARSDLLEELAKVDEERGRLDQKKGKIILNHGKDVLEQAEVPAEKIKTHHRRGALVDTILEFEKDAELVFIGKRGEHADTESPYLGSNLEKVVRAVKHPIFLVSSELKPIEKFVIAYDGKDSIERAIDYICESPLLKGVECHILTANYKEGDSKIKDAAKRLESAGFKPVIATDKDSNIDKVISSYVRDNDMDLLVTGAYSHSRIRSIFLGSTTASLIKSCKVPLLLFR